MEPNREAENGTPRLGSLLKAVVEAIGQGVVVFDDEGKVAYASEAAQALLGPAADGAAGELLRELLERGGRRVALRLGPYALGEAVFLASPDATLAQRERRAILETLQSTGWRLAEAARHLGISRTTLWRRLKVYGVRRDAR